MAVQGLVMVSPGRHARLRPLPWRPDIEPDAPPAAAATEPPLLLLLDRRQPLAEEIRQRLAASLCSIEWQRLSAYRLAADRERFLLGRGVLRLTLGRWLGRDPAGLVFRNGPHGKPALEGAPPFNLSHSGDLVLLAFHGSREVGVDVERERPGVEWQAIGRRMFARERLARLEALPAAQREGGFLTEWCRLEAELKARGTGLAGVSEQAGAQGAADLWDLELPAGHRGAVALLPSLTDRPEGGEAPPRGSRPG